MGLPRQLRSRCERHPVLLARHAVHRLTPYHPLVQVVINAITLVWVTSDFCPSKNDSEGDPKSFSDTLTGSAAICTADTEAVPGLSTSPTESIGTSNVPLSSFAGATVDVVNFPYARDSARMSPSLLPESMLYPYRQTTVEEGGVCLDKGKGRDDSEGYGNEGTRHICSPACSLSSLGAPPTSLPLPPRWRRRSAISPVSRRDQHTEVRLPKCFDSGVFADLALDYDVGLDGGHVPTRERPDTPCVASKVVRDTDKDIYEAVALYKQRWDP